jgi:aryl-alcohol dehydrogenase-like predicted oxidoreductase
MGRAF